MGEQIRSEILETGNEKIKSARIVINAPAEKIFAILTDPRRHKEIDGSSTIQENISGPDKLVLGSKFGMQMHLGIDYRIRNTVVEYRENQLIDVTRGKTGSLEFTSSGTSLNKTSFNLTYNFEGEYDSSGTYILDLINSMYVIAK